MPDAEKSRAFKPTDPGTSARELRRDERVQLDAPALILDAVAPVGAGTSNSRERDRDRADQAPGVCHAERNRKDLSNLVYSELVARKRVFRRGVG
ncbi:hypothetical protein GCM10010329_84230 [Streptomyces spiroverticillatus]|nr:hypothetical protein GCM10010329_84230 [Streptomyces spiroverticillatus]